MRYSQRGFTLIELMVSLALGLIIVAAAVMLFIAGQKSFALQQGAADIQDNANFALNYMAKDIRMANLNAVTATMTASSANGGIVFSTTNLAGISTANVSKSEVSNTSNVDVGSDQLVIQYLPTQAQIDSGLFDCEGTQVQFIDPVAKTIPFVVERYFVRQDDKLNSNETSATALALACDAGRATSAGIMTFSPASSSLNFGLNGQIIMKRVDYFRVLLTVQNSAGSLRDMSISDYVTNAPTARILGVKLGVLTRSNQSVGVDSNIDLTKSFAVLDKTVTLNSTIQNIKTKNLRQVVAQAVAMRNALGDR
ncbi:prepilin-type N-terminal cleavage/methylation domain-containing protein [Acinetobacter brisouii]|uniref:prepilin-type N-terminal cleavage/methylation domain-containing protein n=1 Tax=Acinetobacter brisouii TaxID=396323 RepID=UPI0012505944|nr:prepilin-type N-terminal cleavage/methylation domain-containing protein [Acinetobacter brisouii]